MPDPVSVRYAIDNHSEGERHQAGLAIMAFGLVLVAACVTFVVLAAGDLLG